MTQAAVKLEEHRGIGDNSVGETIQGLAVRYAKCDEESQVLNDERTDIRKVIAGMDLDTKAWQHEITRAKNSSKKKREGYDESVATIRDAIGQMDVSELWSHVEEREEAKVKAREDKKAEQQKNAEAKADKAKSSQKANDV